MSMLEEDRAYRRGKKKGALIAGVIVFLVMALALGYVFILYKGEKQKAATATTIVKSGTVEKINKLIGMLDKYYLYDYDEDTLVDSLYKAVMESTGDPYTVYYTADEYKELTQSNEGVFYGIGAAVMLDQDSDDKIISKVYEDSPAEEGGIEEKDVILAVDGTDVTNLSLSEAVSLIHGDEGTTVTLTVRRGEETVDCTCVRGKIDVDTVGYEILDGNIGYIRISEFDSVTVEQFANAVDYMEDENVDGLIFDVRSNPGGLLTTVTSNLDLLLPEGLIVYTEDKNGKRSEISSDASSILEDMDVPCAVVVDGNTASAAEIFTGALQDYDLAEIIGTQTFGKGIVQSILDLGDGTAVKITVEDYFTPNGNNIHKVGITPDEVVEFDSEAYAADGTDNQLQAAIDYINENKK